MAFLNNERYLIDLGTEMTKRICILIFNTNYWKIAEKLKIKRETDIDEKY